MATHSSFLHAVGHTPCVEYRTPETKARILIKLEGLNPTGSVKDRGGAALIAGAIARGELTSGKTILDASSGNMAGALAYFGRILGFPVTVVCSSKLTADKAQFIRFCGAALHQVGDFTIDGNTYCRDVLVAQEPERYVFTDQLRNWDNPRAHFEATGPEILDDCRDLAMVVGSLGSGGTMNGVARFLKEARPLARVVTVESAPGTKIPGTGAFADGDFVTPFIEQLDRERLIDERFRVTLKAAEARTRDIAAKGFFCGIQTGGVVEAAVRTSAALGIDGEVVAISGDAGWKNMDKLMAL